MDKNLKNLFEELEAEGWEMRKTRKGYYAIPPDPSKEMVQIHLTARGSRSWDNMMAHLKRAGFHTKG